MTMAARDSLLAGRSLAPGGSPFCFRKKARMSAYCWAVRPPGKSSGILFRTRSKRLPTGRPVHWRQKPGPVKSSSVWQLAQFRRNAVSPRSDCASV